MLNLDTTRFSRDEIRHRGILVDRCPKGHRKDLKTGICVPTRDLRLRAQRLNKKPRTVVRDNVKAEEIRSILRKRSKGGG